MGRAMARVPCVAGLSTYAMRYKCASLRASDLSRASPRFPRPFAFSFVVAASFEIRKRLATERPAELVHLASASRGVAVPRRWAVAPRV